MGFTPLQGVIMGTRSGDIDPGLLPHVVNNISKDEGLSIEEAFEIVMNDLNKESGLKALAGTNMMQHIREKALQGDTDAETVISIYAYRIAQYIGAYIATLPNIHAVVFTAGLGENEGYVRKKIISYLEIFDISINEDMNNVRNQEVIIGEANSVSKYPKFLVIPTNEEIVIGYDTLYLGYLKTNLPKVYPFEEE
jgi:acetate kinase